MTDKEKLLGLQDIDTQGQLLWRLVQKLHQDAGLYANDETFDKVFKMYNAVFDAHRAIEDEKIMFALDAEVNK